jgi:rhodanese-related sulfurtransferase
MTRIARITPAQLRKRIDSGQPVLIIDTRSLEAWKKSNVKLPGARRIYVDNLEKHLDKLPRDRQIITYCT